MLSTTFKKVLVSLLCSTTSAIATEPGQSTPSSCSSINTSFTTDSYRSQLLALYLDMWGGNYSLVDQILSPNVSLYQDRLPIGPIPIHNSSAFQAWIEHSRFGYESFEIKTWYWFASEYQIVLRWHLDSIITNVTFHAPGSSLPPGSPIAYNGTDVITLDACTGVINEVDSAQDFLDYFHALGLTTIRT